MICVHLLCYFLLVAWDGKNLFEMGVKKSFAATFFTLFMMIGLQIDVFLSQFGNLYKLFA